MLAEVSLVNDKIKIVQPYYPFDSCDPAIYDEEYLRMPQRYKQARNIQNKLACISLRRSHGNSVIIDFGSGTANDGLQILKEVDNSFYFGIDRSLPMVNLAMSKLHAAGFDARSVIMQSDFFSGSMYDDIKYHLQKAQLFRCVNVVISTLALHHYNLPVKAELFRLVYKLLPKGGRFVLTDLFKNEIQDCDQQAMLVELHDVKLTERRVSLGSANLKIASTMNEHHYTCLNNPVKLALEMNALRETGFGLIDVTFRHGQLAVIVAEKG